MELSPRNYKRLWLLVGLAGLINLAIFLPILVAESRASSENPIVKIETNQGDIVLRLYADKAPKTVENFSQLRGARTLRGHIIPSGDKGLHDPRGGLRYRSQTKRGRADGR